MALILDMVTRAPNDTELERVNLATGAQVLKYVPRTPKKRSVESSSPLRHGTRIQKTTYADVDEGAEFLYAAASDAAMLAFTQSLERAFETAARRQERQRGPRVFLEMTLNRMSAAFRSEIKRGDFTLEEGALDVGWRSRKLVVQPAWLRAHYWEAVVESEIALQSKATARATGGVTITNHWDGGAGDGTWVQVLGSDVPGVIDAPLRLQITNQHNSAGTPQTLYVAQNIDADPANLNPVLESDAGAWIGTSSAVASSDHSNGSARSVTWSADSEIQLCNWTLSETLLAQLGGAAVRVFAKFSAVDPGARLNLKVRYQNITVLDETPEVLLGTALLQDLGTLRLAPWAADAGSPSELNLILYGRKTGGSAFTLDFLHLMPLDGYVEYRAQGYGLPYTWTLVDDGIDGIVHVTNGATNAGFWVKRPHDGFMIRPNTTQRLYILQGGVSEIARPLSVRAYYRERRLSL